MDAKAKSVRRKLSLAYLFGLGGLSISAYCFIMIALYIVWPSFVPMTAPQVRFRLAFATVLAVMGVYAYYRIDSLERQDRELNPRFCACGKTRL